MNIGGNYFYVIFFKDDKIVHKGEKFCYRQWDDADSEKLASKYEFEYDRYEAEFLREESPDEM